MLFRTNLSCLFLLKLILKQENQVGITTTIYTGSSSRERDLRAIPKRLIVIFHVYNDNLRLLIVISMKAQTL